MHLDEANEIEPFITERPRNTDVHHNVRGMHALDDQLGRRDVIACNQRAVGPLQTGGQPHGDGLVVIENENELRLNGDVDCCHGFSRGSVLLRTSSNRQ